ncbi:hypothetical protein KCU67_g45, partial [Aureobasidium melanogenum]
LLTTLGLIDTALTRLPPPDRSHPNGKPYQGYVEGHVQLLGIARQILQILARDPRINGNASPTIMHPDLHLHNIFVDPDDPTTMTAFIDWQGTSIEPAFEHAGMNASMMRLSEPTSPGLPPCELSTTTC